MRWELFAGTMVVIAGAIGAGAFVFASGGSASCDEVALTVVMAERIALAEANGATEISVALPSGCADDDMVAAMPAVSREWHAMPGGVMMREGQHAGP